MARTFLLSLIVALLLVFALTEASRGQTNQTDGQKITNRGTARYNSKSTTESSSLSTPESRLPRDKSSRLEAVANLEKHETHFAREGSIRSRTKLKQSQAADDSTTTSRTSTRHLNTSVDNSRNRQKSHATQALKEEITRDDNKENAPESRTPKRLTASRRTSSDASLIWVDNIKLDHEVFTKSDHLRSRTGRKIAVNHGRESKGEIIPTRKSPENENVEKAKSPSKESEKEEIRLERSKVENVTSKANMSKKIDSTNNSDSHKDQAKDVLLSGSESIRVNVPLTVGNDEDPNLLTSTTASSVSVSPRQASRSNREKIESNDIARSSTKKSRQSNQSKSRNRSKTRDPNLETANSGSTSRRGSSRSSSTATVETNRRSSNSRHRSSSKNVNSRGRSTHKSRDAVTAEARNSDRQRNTDTDSETNANRQTDTRRNDRRTSEGKRRSKDSRSKAEVKVDEQDIRVQSRSRSRATTSNLDITTTYVPKATIAETTTVPSLDAEITTSSSTTTIRPSTTTRTSTSTERVSRNRGRDRGESSRAIKPPKEDFFNYGLGFRGRKSSTEASSSIVAEPRTTTPKSETQLRGNPGWTLRRRPGHVNQDASSSTTSMPINRDQINEIVLSTDSPRSTETPLNNAKAGRRGTKRPKAKDESDIVSGVAAKGTTRGSKTFNKSENFGLPKGTEPESDNYPPAFRARLSQLKNSNSKPTEEKSTTRTNLQATKPSLTSLFSERSKLKLELARRLIKPELNVDENDFDVTTAAYSGKSKTKEVSTVSESRNIEKTTKATSKLIGTRATHGSSTIASAPKEKSIVRGRWKILQTRKSTKDRNVKSSLRSPAGTAKKIRVTSERTASFIEETTSRNVTEFNAIPRLITVSQRGAVPVEGTAATTIDTTKVRSPTSTTARDEVSTLTNTVEATEENTIITTVEPLKLDKTFIETITATSGAVTDASTESKVPTEFPQEVTLPPTITTVNDILSSSTLEKVYPVYIPNANDLSGDKEKTITPSDSSKSSVRSRYTSQEQPDKVTISMVTSRTVGPTSRYIRKKSGVFTPYNSIPKATTTEVTLPQTKRREFRPRTSTYRRHSEVPTSLVVQPPTTIEQTTAGIAITPKPTKYHAQVEPSTRSSPSDPLVSVRIDTSNDTTSQASGIAGSSNGNSGNSNIFNPTRSTYLTANTTTLLEQLRSTVAPLLNNLGDKTPIFSGAYSNVNTGNSVPRITPNGSPPRFSARYKGAELFVRKPSFGQAMVPSITTSSTTASTLIENSGSAPPVAINSPGEPRFITFYQALESASIRNENLGAEDVSQRQRLTGVVTKVDPNATVPNDASNDIANNNDTIAPSITATTTTSSPDITTVDITTAVQSANNSLASLGAENSTDGSPETTTTVQTPENPDTNGGETTPIPTSETSGTTVPVNTITNTPPSTTTETITSTSVADITLAAESSTESVPNDVQSTELSTKTTEVATLPITETVNARISMPASQNLQMANDTSDTTIPSPITKSVTVMHLPLEATTILAMNDTSESIETNTVQQSEETTPRLTETTITIEDIETNTIQQSDTTDSSQTMEITSTTEPTTTEEILNDVIEIRATAIPAFSTTYRTRLVDYAQDILSLLSQKGVTTINTPVPRPTATTTVSPELSNAIPDSSSTNTENSAQPEETTTMRLAAPDNNETTESFDVEFMSITTDGSEETNRNTVGVNTTLQGQSNDQGINAQNTLDSNTATEQTFSNIIGNERNTTSDPESTTTAQDARAPTTDGEIATTTLTPTSRLVESVTENDPRSSNDTLLAELMTIAKTLFTEAMNDTRQLGQTDGTVGNDKNRTVFVLNSASEAAPSELPKHLENTTEHIDITIPIDLVGNEREDNSTRDPVVGSNILLVESNARPTDVGDVTTMSLSQMKTEISTITTVTASMSSELTTNTPDSQLFNSIESSNNNTEQQTITTVSNNETQLLNRLLEFATNNPLANSVTANTEGMSTSDVNNSTTSDMVTELTTSVAMTEINIVQTNAVDTTNQTPVPITTMSVSDLQVTNDQSLIALDITTILPMISDTSDTQPFDTEPSITESVRNLVSFTDTTTNQLNDITTNAPQMLTDLVSEMPNFIARLQDTTSTTTAQGTAGSRIIQPEQTTETIITTTVPNITSSTASTTDSITSPVSSTNASTIPSSSVESTIATTTTETTTTTSTTTFRTTSTETSRSELTTTVESTSEMTTTTADINDNLVSTETTTDTSTTRGTTIIPTESEDLNMISRINDGEGTTTATTTTTSVASPTNGTNNTSTTTTTSTTARTTVLNRVSPFPGSTPFQPGPYLGRFGGSQMTPLPRSSSSKAPVRDYLIYGIYPNKTIVRKRPEDNVIDGRNVDSPYVIFGIYPDGRLVRKFPNGTIIPESSRNPVEVVFTLRTTTTTNRPAPRPYYNQANQAGVYNNQYQAPVYYSNDRPVDDLTRGAQNPGSFDFGLIGNAIGVTPGGPNFTGPPASIPSTNKMSDILLNSQMGTLPNSFGNQRPNSNQVQGPPRIIQDRERNEASRTRVTSDQNSAVYIGQDKFINYQIDGAPDINPKVVDVRINSVATSVNEGTASSTASNPSFENLLNNQSGGNVITAPPGFPWRDPLDQIFGITTNSPIQTASVASNQLDEPTRNNAPIVSRVNSMVEIFTPIVSTAVTSPSTTTTTTASTTTPITTTTVSTTTPTTTSTTTPTTTTTSTTTTPAPTRTAATTTAATTTTTTTTTSTTTPATITTSQTTTPASIGIVPPSSTASTISTNNILSRLQANTVENPFGSTYGDLAFLNSLLQNNNDVKSTTPKTLSEVEQLLANRILSLALANPGPTRSAKAIQTANSNANVNVIKNPSKSTSFGLSEPIIIDLLPLTSPPPSISSSMSPTKKYTETITTTKASTAPTVMTKAPVVITAKPKTTARPKTTTPRASVGFGSGLWRALFGNNFFDATTAATAAKKKPTIKATTKAKSASSTQAPAQIIKSTLTNQVMTSIKSPTTPRNVDISDIHVASSTSLADSIISASTPSTISTTLLNNPNPRLRDVSTSTYSPEDDAKFLAALLQAVQTAETKTSTSATTRLNEDDEAFLRAILNNQASISTTTSSSTEVNPAALLALLLKQQGIEPTTPATKLREQLQLSNQGLLMPDAISTTTRPTTTRPITIAKQVVTSRPSARPRPTENILQTTTWAPSSTYPPPLFGGSGSGSGLVTATRAIGRFLGAAISGAAQQLQSLLRNSTRSAAG